MGGYDLGVEASMTTSGNTGKASPEEAAVMREVMASIRSRAHFRYPVDGNWSEIESILHTALDEMYGPDSPSSPQNRWVRKLRHFGLIR
jgi:hypothetical protein